MFLIKIHKIQVCQMLRTVLEKFITTAKQFHTVCRKHTQCCRFIITKHLENLHILTVFISLQGFFRY